MSSKALQSVLRAVYIPALSGAVVYAGIALMGHPLAHGSAAESTPVRTLSDAELNSAWGGSNPDGQCVASSGKYDCLANVPQNNCGPSQVPNCNGTDVVVGTSPAPYTYCYSGNATQNCTQTNTFCATWENYTCVYGQMIHYGTGDSEPTCLAGKDEHTGGNSGSSSTASGPSCPD
jgi:hypothetical protein